LTLIVGACTGSTPSTSSAQPPDQAPSAPSGATSDAPPASAATGPQIGPEPVTIVALDHHFSPGVADFVDSVYEAFMKKYPQVTIERISKGYEENINTQKLALSGDDGPDLAMTGTGFAGLGGLVENGLVVPLDKYYDDWGWRDHYGESWIRLHSFSDDAKVYGSGSVYGVSDATALLGVYYSQAKLDQFGAAYPATLAEFEAICDKAVAAGEVCIQLGNIERWPALNSLDILIDQFESPGPKDQWFFLDPTAKLSDGVRDAVARWQDWAQKGYFVNGFDGKGYSQATTDFVDGSGVFLIDGSWVGSDVAVMGDSVGMKAMPPVSAGGPVATFGAGGDPWVISARSKHPDVAAALLDFWQSPEGRQISADSSFLPPFADGLTFPERSVIQAQADLLTAANEDGGLSTQVLFATPTSISVIGEATQRLMDGQITPDEFMKILEDDRTTFIESR